MGWFYVVNDPEKRGREPSYFWHPVLTCQMSTKYACACLGCEVKVQFGETFKAYLQNVAIYRLCASTIRKKIQLLKLIFCWIEQKCKSFAKCFTINYWISILWKAVTDKKYEKKKKDNKWEYYQTWGRKKQLKTKN